MIFTVPGCGGPERRDVPNNVLAQAFWGSYWGRRAALEASEPTPALLSYLTGSRALGGLQATWQDRTGLPELRDLVARTRPEGTAHG